MSFGDGGQIASGGSTGNNQASLTVATTAAVNAGELVVVAVTVDNKTATGGDDGDVSGVTIGGVALTKGRQVSPAVTSQTAAAVSLWYGQPGAISSGANIVATFANATTSDASALSARKFTVPSGATITLAGTNATTGTTTNPGSLDFTGDNVAHLRIRAIGCEFDSTQTLTVTGSWTAWTEGASSTSGTTTEQVIEVEHRIVTGTTGASAPTLGSACDSSSVYLAFTEANQGSLTISGSSTLAFIGAGILPPDQTSFTNTTPVQFSKAILYPTLFEAPLGRVFGSGQLTIAGSTTVAFIGSVAPPPEVPIHYSSTVTTVTFNKSILYPTLFEPPAVTTTILSGTLAISGSTTVSFIGSQVLAGTFSTSGSTTVNFSGQSITQAALTIDLGTAVAWIGTFVSTGAGALIIQGQTDVAFIGRATAEGTLAISGSTTVAFNGSAVKPTTLTIGGSTDVAFIGRSTAQTTLTIAGSTTVSWIGSAVKPTTLAISTGTSNVQFVGAATAQGTLTIDLGTAVAWIGVASAAGSGTMIVSGSTTVAFTGRSIAQGVLSISGSTTASFSGVSLFRTTLTIGGSTTVSWIGQSRRQGTAVMAGSTTVSWIGSAIRSGTLTIAGSTTAAFTGRSIAAGLFTIVGSSTPTWIGRSDSGVYASVGTTDVNFIGAALQTRSGQFTISGSTDITWIGVGSAPPEPGQFAISGSSDIAWIGETVTQILVPPPEGYESQVGVWHVREVPRRGGRSRWSGRTGKRYRIYAQPPPEPPGPHLPLWILNDGYWLDGGIWIDTEVWED